MIADCCLCHLMLFADIICREQNYNKMNLIIPLTELYFSFYIFSSPC